MVTNVHAWRPEIPSVREVYYANFDHAYPMHTHDTWGVLIVDHGAVTYRMDRHEHAAIPGAITLLPPGIPHDGQSASNGKNYRKRVLYLEPDWLPDRTTDVAADEPTLSVPGTLRSVRRIHSALIEPGDLLAAEYWLIRVRDDVLRHLGTASETVSDAPLARRLRELLDDRYTESFTIAEAATELGANPSHLVRAFSKAYGIAPHQYVISHRVYHARRLLVDGYRPADAAAEAGFYDQAHLTRHFKHLLGTTPAAFRGS